MEIILTICATILLMYLSATIYNLIIETMNYKITMKQLEVKGKCSCSCKEKKQQ